MAKITDSLESIGASLPTITYRQEETGSRELKDGDLAGLEYDTGLGDALHTGAYM